MVQTISHRFNTHVKRLSLSASVVIYKYNILERVIVENIIPRNLIINRDAVEVDNHISRDDFFDYHPLKNVIFILLYRTLFLNFSSFFPLTM